jgi:hypothetical protein
MSNANDVIILGAPRSGTNMLRDVLTSLPGYGTWDCDEINLTWRHGNRDFPSDELQAQHATPEVKRFLRREFDKVRAKSGTRSVVEKTCANSLRVEFVHRVAPDARYLWITRDGLDAAASAVQRWRAPLDVKYTAAKVKYVPPGDLPYYGLRFVSNHWRKRSASADASISHGWWGPKPHDWDELSKSRPLDEVALIQWQRCITVTERGLAEIPSGQVHHVVYEDFVRNPVRGLRDVLAFLGDPGVFDAEAVAGVKSSSVGKGRSGFSPDARERLAAVAGDTLEGHGYDR